MPISLTPARKWATVLLLVLLGVIGVTGQVEASDGMRGDRCIVLESETIVEDFYFFCRVLEVYGTIDGDLLGVASEITIGRTAVITGDIWTAGGRLRVEGTVGDDVHFVGVSATISDRANFTHNRVDLFSVAVNTEIAQDAALPGDLLVYGYQARVNGTVGGDVDFGGEALIINGVVNGRVDAAVGDVRRSTDIPGLPIYDVSFSNPGLRVGPEAYIGGDLKYESASRTQIPFGVVQGQIDFEQVLSQPDITQAEQAEVIARILVNYIKESLRDAITLLLVGGMALWLLPNFIRQPAQHVQRRTVPTIGWGLIAFMLSFPAAVLLLAFSLLILLILFLLKLNELTVITAVGLLVINLVTIGGFWFLLLFLGRVVISFVIGQVIYRYVLRQTDTGRLRYWLVMLAIGAAVYALITNAPIPALGLTVELITALAGIGAVVMYARTLVYKSEMLGPVPVAATAAPAAPPPLPDDVEAPLGMENLPEGFRGFDD
ncbi:MAG: hypothetical protein GXY36_14110 [Chloroflexi bacterium]|nr:hypothetical protein [Chloroflexota bacterium]